ncbi:MAG: hypothetical protein M1832_004013 [Thelocarpon impressellum]|nr:MAG: hypothetical protein M1832_004013 [Thelocarpon impressellum]
MSTSISGGRDDTELGVAKRCQREGDGVEVTISFASKFYMVRSSTESFPPGEEPQSALWRYWKRTLADLDKDSGDEDMTDDPMSGLMKIARTSCQPLFREEDSSTLDNQGQKGQDLDTFLNPMQVMLLLIVGDGKESPRVVEREGSAAPRFEHHKVDQTLSLLTDTLPSYYPHQIIVLEDLWAMGRVTKVQVGQGPIWVCKIAGIITHDSLEKEIDALQRVAQATDPSSFRVSALVGYVRASDDDGTIGVLLQYIEPKGEDDSLKWQPLATIPASTKDKWARQIEETVERLHSIDVIWGDVKPDNVLIDVHDDAWIIDFGGGRTVGIVDENISGTKEGDLQGLGKILDFLRSDGLPRDL